jgi:hypothetical protein
MSMWRREPGQRIQTQLERGQQVLRERLPVAAPEIVEHEGRTYIASLLPSLKGIRIARLEWESAKKLR